MKNNGTTNQTITSNQFNRMGNCSRLEQFTHQDTGRKTPWLKRKKATVALKEVDWSEYFTEIKSQCPWSNQAYKQNKILITEWHSHPQELGEYKAIVYTAENLSIRLLKKITQRLNQMTEKEQFFWSHPRLGEFNTPIPVIIQQSREELLYLRNSLKLH